MNLTESSPSSVRSIKNEWIKTLLAAVSFCLVLTTTSMLRPIRDQISTSLGPERLPELFSWTLAFTVCAVPMFGLVVKLCPRKHLVNVIYGAMIASMSFFFMTLGFVSAYEIKALFFAWLSSANLIAISLFWSVVSDSFSTEEAKRCYGYIAIGGTIGAVIGPAVTGQLVKLMDVSYLFAITMACLGTATFCLNLLRMNFSSESNSLSRPIGGSIFAGITRVARSPMLIGIALLVVCYSTVSTALYSDLVAFVKRTYADPAEQAAFYARLDLMVNSFALTFQLLGTRAILRRVGVRWSLTMAPAILFPTLLWFGLRPTAIGYSLVQVLNRSFEFSFSKPGREVLFTTVDSESRYKAKNFIDTLVYRSSDSAIASINSIYLHYDINTIKYLALPATFCWLIVAQLLTFAHSNKKSSTESLPTQNLES